ncbi:MAG TPA: glycosyl hydrolase family 28 protein, partial [Chthonomonadaceae bacterium]|nr:glycosyl hydrolase family 28 protein [Chthonomonadaceae bacterium]
MLLLIAVVLGALAPQGVSPEISGVYEVRQYGARGDGQQKDTVAVQAAIDAAAAHGGGTVHFAPGRYLCGTLHLRSHLTLRIDSGATLLTSREKADLDPYEALNYDSHADEETTDFHLALLAGQNLEDIAIDGHGTLEGNRTERGGPKMIALKNCQAVTIRDVTVQNSPNYSVSLLGCEHVNIDGITVRNSYADGIDPDCCRFVRIANCNVDSHDDAICLKSSLALGTPHPTEFVTITNCVLRTACNYFKMGTESSGAFRRIALSNCTMSRRTGTRNADRDRGGIAIETVDGAEIDGVVVANLTMEDVACPIFLRLGNRGRGQS